MLECAYGILEQLKTEIAKFKEAFTVFLCARDPSSCAVTQQQINRVWALFERLPLYSELKIQGRGARQLMGYLRTHPDEIDDMLTDGTERNRVISTDEWNRQVARIQELKEQAETGALSDVELKKKFDAI